MKSNPNVYPYTPFKDLSNKDVKNNFVSEKIVNFSDVKDLLLNIKNPEIEVFGETVEERIFSIFLNNEIRFGPKEFLLENKDSWLEKIGYFVQKNEKIQFSILGFPFKIPVPLKTDRTLPDMGEMLAINRLDYIAELCNKEYAPGVKITIFSEGGFDKTVGVSNEKSVKYHNFLLKSTKAFSFEKNIDVLPLSDMEKNDNFEKLYEQKIADLKDLYDSNDEKYLEKYNGTQEAVYRIVNTVNYSQEVLMDVYNDNLSDNDVSDEVLRIRKDIEKRTHEAIFMYHAYLMVRDDLDYLEGVIPKALTLSVSPKPNRLGIFPINDKLKRLPYHSVPVFNVRKDEFTTEYLIDVKRDDAEFEKVFLEESEDKAPFYYIKNEKREVSSN